MAYLKTETINIQKDGLTFVLKVKINVNNNGKFSTLIDKKYKDAIIGVFNSYKINKDNVSVMTDSLDELVNKLKKMLDTHNNPKIHKENIIAYNIKSDIAFAEDKEGRIYPNIGYAESAKWCESNKYGSHHATNPCKDGYSLTIGAKAYTKITKEYQNNKVVTYDLYYGENGVHLGNSNPAERLNSWTSISINPDTAKQIPYSDKNADFFFNLMLGMANIAKTIQNKTFEKAQLLQLINSSQNNLLSN